MIELGRKVSSTGACPGCERRVVYLRHPHHRAIPHLLVAEMFVMRRGGAPVRHDLGDCLAEQLG